MPANNPYVNDASAITLASITNQQDLHRILESEHPIYTKNKKMWQDILDLYQEEDTQRFIYRHMREREVAWRKRQERSYLFNYVQSIIDLIASFIYSKSIQRHWESPSDRENRIREIKIQQLQDDFTAQQQSEQDYLQAKDKVDKEQKMQFSKAQKMAEKGKKPVMPPQQEQQTPPNVADSQQVPDILREARIQQILDAQEEHFSELTEFWRDVDFKGTSIDDFSKMIFICTQIFGHIDVFVDMPQVPDDHILETEFDRKEASIRPYAFIIFPLDMLNWEVGADGRFMWIRWREEIVGDIAAFQKRGPKKSYRYFTWTRNDFFIHEIRYNMVGNVTASLAEAKVELVHRDQNRLGEIPVARFFNKRHLADPIIGVSAFKSIAKINIEILNLCSLIDEEVYQKCLNILAMQEPAEKKASIEIGSNNVLLWEGEHPPFYLAPTSEPDRFILDLIERCTQEIYRIAKLGGESGTQTQEAQSGIAYTWEFNQTNRMLSDKADMMERGEYELHRLWALWLGLKWEGLINYPDNFNVEKFEDEVKRIVEVKGAVRSPEFKRVLEKRLAMRALAKIPTMEQARIFAEIDVLPEEKPFSPYPPQQ